METAFHKSQSEDVELCYNLERGLYTVGIANS